MNPMFSPVRIVSAACGLSTAALAQDGRAPVEPKSLPLPEQKVEEAKPNVEQLDDHTFRIGRITFDKKTREIRLPTRVNMTDGLLEFLLVRENGKLHESLLMTDASAIDLNLAFKLLRYLPSREWYAIPNDSGGLTSGFPEVSDEVKRAARIDIGVEWKDGDETRRASANEWIQHAVKGGAMRSGPWVYGGSEVFNGKFAPESTGDLIAIFITNSALINYPGEDNRDDTVWLPYPKRVPAEGTEVTLVISPAKPTEIESEK